MKTLIAASGTSINLHAAATRGDSHSFMLRLHAVPDGQQDTDISYHWDIGRLILERTHSSFVTAQLSILCTAQSAPNQEQEVSPTISRRTLEWLRC
jgi:hypothetical protein